MTCKWIHVVLLLAIAVFALFGPFIGWMLSKWVIFVAALVLLIHAFVCKKCNECWSGHEMKKPRKR